MAGNGSMRERAPGVWTLRVETSPQNEKRKWVTGTFHGSEKGAKKALRELLAEVESRPPKARESSKELTFSKLFDLWIGSPTSTGRQRAESTQYQERRRFERHVKPEFGNRIVVDVDRSEIKRFSARLLSKPRTEGASAGSLGSKPLSSTSVARIHETLRAMCTWALEEDLISTSPLIGVRKPSVPLPPPKAPTMKQVQALLDYLLEEDLALWCAVRLAGTIGIRRSEVVALTWRDIDWAEGSIKIDKGIVAIPRLGRVETDTKTGVEGSADLHLDKELLTRLHELNLEGMARNDYQLNWGYIFSDHPTGETGWHPDTITSRLARARKQVRGADDVTLKSLRAFTASEVAKETDMKTAQLVLRHKSERTTMRHYAAAQATDAYQVTRGLGKRLASKTQEVERPHWTDDDAVEARPQQRS